MPAAAGSAWPPGEAPIDLKALDGLRDLERQGSEGLVARVVRLYLDSAPALLEELRGAIARSDLDGMRNAAHSLKSSSANIGALRLSALCREIEMLGRARTLGNAPERIADLDHELERVTRTLESQSAGQSQ